jgi:hypothetical protein
MAGFEVALCELESRPLPARPGGGGRLQGKNIWGKHIRTDDLIFLPQIFLPRISGKRHMVSPYRPARDRASGEMINIEY